jgi:hypothetical protein
VVALVFEAGFEFFQGVLVKIVGDADSALLLTRFDLQ